MDKDPKNLPLQMFDPATIEQDPATYQYRRGANGQSGVTAKHKLHGDKWNTVLHGDPLLVHVRKDGKIFVVDGHHRLSFAKQLKAEGKEAPAQVAAYVMREADGYTAEDAKIIAAYKNIHSGKDDLIDTIRVFKEANSGKVHMSLLPSLQMDKGNLKIAYTLSGLSDGTITKIEKGEVPVESALYVAEHVEKPRQEHVIELVGAMIKQEYPAANPFAEAAHLLKPKGNDNFPMRHQDRIMAERKKAKAFSKNVV